VTLLTTRNTFGLLDFSIQHPIHILVNQTARCVGDAGPSNKASIARVVKRKRRASCPGEQERQERKRAINREAQRSSREKTKTHIAELGKSIQIPRDQDRNGATASLLGKFEEVQQENESLRDVTDSVKSVVGNEIVSRAAPPISPASGSGKVPITVLTALL
jgi:hypothetical protein